MICDYCEREIEKDERFYEIDGGIYCSDCVSESTLTYYIIGNNTDKPHSEDDVSEYNSIEDFVSYLTRRMNYIKSEK